MASLVIGVVVAAFGLLMFLLFTLWWQWTKELLGMHEGDARLRFIAFGVVILTVGVLIATGLAEKYLMGEI